MKDKLAQLRLLADEILGTLQWREPHQYNSFAHGIDSALMAAHTSLNGPCQARTKNQKQERIIDVLPYRPDGGAPGAPVSRDASAVVPIEAFAVNPQEVA